MVKQGEAVIMAHQSSKNSKLSSDSGWKRFGRRLLKTFLSFIAILGGLITSLLIQAVFSGIARADVPDFSYRLSDEDQVALRQQLDACGNREGCFMEIIGASATLMKSQFEAGLREMHPLVRRVTTQGCQRRGQLGWILMTQCGRDALHAMQEDVRLVQLARTRDNPPTAESIYSDLERRNHFSAAILHQVCQGQVTPDCFDGNLAVLRGQLLRAHDAMSESFVQAATLSSAVYFCSQRTGFGRCSAQRSWNESIRISNPNAIPYGPLKVLPGLTARSIDWTLPTDFVAPEAAETSSGSAGAGRGTRGRGRGAHGVRGAPGRVGNRGGSGAGSAEGSAGAPVVALPPTVAPQPPTELMPLLPPPSPPTAEAVPPMVPPSVPNSVSNVPAGTPPQEGAPAPEGVTPVPVPSRDRYADERERMSGIQAAFDSGNPSAEGCSAERMATYEEVIATATRTRRLVLAMPDPAVVVAEVSRYSCEVQSRFASNVAARFLSEQLLGFANTYVNTNEGAAEVLKWVEEFDLALGRLESEPLVAGHAELVVFHEFVSRQRASAASSDFSNLPEAAANFSDVLYRNSSMTHTYQAFCPWKRALELDTPGSTEHFPKSLLNCR